MYVEDRVARSIFRLLLGFRPTNRDFFFFFGLVGFYIYVAFILLNYAGFSMTHDFRTALEE